MTKKEQVFELFTQGKRMISSEVKALDLKPNTLRRYWLEWLDERRARALAAEKPAEVIEVVFLETAPTDKVLVSSLRAGQEFEYEGNRYRICPNHTVALLEWAPSGKFRVERQGGVSPDTLVKPIT